jgi:cell wall-associated NlpC family hydrolase
MGAIEKGDLTEVIPEQINKSSAYKSPYKLHFNFKWSDLVRRYEQPLHSLVEKEANPQYFTNEKSWYNPSVYKSHPEAGTLSWGPEPNHYLLPEMQDNDKRKAQRLVAVAASMIGYGYRHHQIPDWNPDQEWYDKNSPSYSSTLSKHVGKGLDCSNYTSWLYNYGLGIYLNTNIKKRQEKKGQGEMIEVKDSAGNMYKVTRVAQAKDDYATLCSKLQTGDLLYIAGDPKLSKADIQNQLKSTSPSITHVIMWLGDVSVSTNNIPLITDSYGSELRDENNVQIPTGIQVRPFNDATVSSKTPTDKSSQSWYFDHFVWALRILPTL